MSYLHKAFFGGPETTVEVVLDHQADVFLVDDHNYHAFRAGRGFRYFGGHAVRTPVVLAPPHTAHWNVVVLPPPGGHVHASIAIGRC